MAAWSLQLTTTDQHESIEMWNKAKISLFITSCFVVLFIASCSTIPEKSPLETEPNKTAIEKASALEATDPAGAAVAFSSIAANLQPPWRQSMQIRAASAYLLADNFPDSLNTLQSLDRNSAFNETLFKADLLMAQITVRSDDESADYQTAYDQIKDYLLEDAPAEYRPALYETQATLLEKLNQPMESVKKRVQLKSLLTDPETQAANNIRIWQLLNQAPFETINALMPPPPDEYGAWIELVYFVNQHRTRPKELADAIDAWKVRYPTHPAAGPLVSSLIEMLMEELEPPEQIALLLPLSGRLKGPGEAIRDGFIAASLEHFQIDRPRIRVYDVGDNPALITDHYRRAINDGADYVVGPLDKTALEILAQSSDISTPILGLNYLPDFIETSSTLFQYGLLPEDEASEAARHAFLSGGRKALVLVPDNEWGKRNAIAFGATFRELGGSILEEKEFDPTLNDFSGSIKSLLNLDDSQNRYRQITSITGAKLEYEPRRRADVDIIFIAAAPKQARLIRPQFKFHRASQIPVYATSRLFTGVINPKQDGDLDGIFFVDIPWLLSERKSILRNDLEEFWPERMQRYLRLFAMGIDAYRLIAKLPDLRHNPGSIYRGTTGELHLENGRVHRQLELGRFIRGEPILQKN